MLNQIKDWQGAIDINGTHFESFPSDLRQFNGDLHIKLYPKVKKPLESSNMKMPKSNIDADNEVKTGEIKITVKAYMTRKASPEFDFMAKWNNDNPMPLRTMVGVIDKETPGMYHMNLHGKGEAEIKCMRCGRTLTNPISRHYGIGPECLSKLGLTADIDDVSLIKEQLVNVKWSGWVIRSSIINKEEI